MSYGIIGNPRGMSHQDAFHAANHFDANRNRLMDELRPESIEVARRVDKNNDRRIDVMELSHALAQGDVFINLNTRSIGAFNKPLLDRLFG